MNCYKSIYTSRGKNIVLRKICLLIVTVFVVLQSATAYSAVIDPSFEFFTIETQHFAIHYHDDLKEVADRTANIAENAHNILTKQFNWIPDEKTQIVLIDSSDMTNGSASVIPYNTIYLYVAPPGMDTTIGEYEDWLEILIFHEYTHILTMDTTNGYSRITRRIFGKPAIGADILSLLLFIPTAPPNLFLPGWWTEGIATWAETEYTGIGRGRSTFYEMIFRMAVADNNIPTIDKINGDVADWPSGNLRYLFGMKLHKYIADTYGKNTPAKLTIGHAATFPYLINRVPAKLLNRKTYVSLYRDMVEEMKKKQRKKIETLKSKPLTPFKRLEIEGELLSNPRYSPDGKMIAFNRIDPHDHTVIMVTDRSGKKVKTTVRRVTSDHTLSWSPDSRKIYYAQAEIIRGFNLYQDIYSYNIDTKRQKRLTHGLRVKEPDVSPDSNDEKIRFAAVITKSGSQNLAILDISPDTKGDSLEIVTDYKLKRISQPRWSPDGNSIVYAVTHNNGFTGIYIYDVKTKKERRIFEKGFDSAYPSWSKDGQTIFYTSDETNVFNIFAYSLKKKKRYQVTHVQGGAFQAHVSPDSSEMIFSTYDSKGTGIAIIKNTPRKWLKETGPAIEISWNRSVHSSGKGENEQPVTPLDSQPYSALKTVAPRFWLPTLSSDHAGLTPGAFTLGRDVLGYNTYLLRFGYGATSGEGYYDALYLNDYFYPTFSVRSFSMPVQYSNYFERGSYFEQNKSLILGTVIPVNYLESNYGIGFGYQFQNQTARSKLTNGGYKGIPVFQGDRGNLYLGFTFSNSLKYPYSISHEEGRSLSLLSRFYVDGLGSDLDSREYLLSWSEQFAITKLKHHVLHLRFKGALSGGDWIPQQAFQLGGSPPDVEVEGQGFVSSRFPLRGYPSRFQLGKYITTGTLEYRMPLKYIYKGKKTRPFFWEKLHGALFMDIGNVWDDREDFGDHLKVGAGIEIRLDMTLGYMLKMTPAFGIAHGFDSGGVTTPYITFYTEL